MRIAGLTIAKNCNKFEYPIAEVIEQHKDFFDVHFIGVSHEDNDGTFDLIENTCKKLGIEFGFVSLMDESPIYKIIAQDKDNGRKQVIAVYLDWPNEDQAWTEESLDKKLQQYMLDNIDWYWSNIDWIVKLDADEFYNDEDISLLKTMMEMLKDEEDVSAIAHNYLQFCGSLEYTIFDPTKYVCHIFKPYKAEFVGNDAMQFRPIDGSDTVYLKDIYLHHIGYVKDPNLITIRIREHLILNESMYSGAVLNKPKWKTYRFEFPRHKQGAKLWPLGISDLPNETEYFKYDTDKLPSVLQNKMDLFNFYKPEF